MYKFAATLYKYVCCFSLEATKHTLHAYVSLQQTHASLQRLLIAASTCSKFTCCMDPAYCTHQKVYCKHMSGYGNKLAHACRSWLSLTADNCEHMSACRKFAQAHRRQSLLFLCKPSCYCVLITTTVGLKQVCQVGTGMQKLITACSMQLNTYRNYYWKRLISDKTKIKSCVKNCTCDPQVYHAFLMNM